ncbi:HET-domain-containing protein [Periconia macrospinosa]|uniref:HET-domain-containing protein n=1 Tax=Periconia macrospinosa TaxID=97972 RepID=A0A2V1DH49_9PLEO|nr:HET-domain-containing protein [Periconia macrospinosa]
MEPIRFPDARRRFDHLCDVCKMTFQGDFFEKERSTKPHRNIYTLSTSAGEGCHMCSLIMVSISPEVVDHLKLDLDNSFVDHGEQIVVAFEKFEEYSSLDVLAQSPSLPPCEFDFIWSDGRYRVAHLVILPSSDDDCSDRIFCDSNYSELTIMQITKWLGQCIREHTDCFDMQVVAATRDILPTRLLDLTGVKSGGQVRLISTESLPRNTIYATLSHCWGGGCALTLTTDNLARLEAGVSTQDLPKTFRDSVVVTLDLNIAYLWIDALCIIQDSVGDQDWLYEASIMGDIYANSYITIAATTSPNSNGGLIHQRNPLQMWPCRLRAQSTGLEDDVLVVKFSEDCPRGQRPLSDRAWAYQEWLLSRRLLHFCADQVRWECYCLAASEVWPDGLRKDDPKFCDTPTKVLIAHSRSEPEKLHTLWESIRGAYSGKLLTKSTDRLAAFAGIARMVHQVLKSPSQDYVAGLWKPEILQELLWIRYGDNICVSWDMDAYIAPTWSWASVNGRHYISKTGHNDMVYHASAKTEMVPVGDEYGPIKSAKLLLKCSPSTIVLSYGKERSTFPSLNWSATAIRDLSTDIACALHLDDCASDQSPQRAAMVFSYIPILSYKPTGTRVTISGLVIRASPGPRSQFIRIGVLDLLHLDKNQDEVFQALRISRNSQEGPDAAGSRDRGQAIEEIEMI